MRAKQLPQLGLALVLMGCGDLPPINYETEYVLIGSDAPLCGASLREFDEQVRAVEEALDFRVAGKLKLYLFQGGVAERCGEPATGCYDVAKKQVYSSIEPARHELVHAAVHQISHGDPLFDEGIADDLTKRQLGFAISPPSSNLGLYPYDVSRITATHFMRWLRTTYSTEQVKNIFIYSTAGRGSNHTRKAFEKATGDSFAEAEQRYYETAPEFYAPLDILPPPLAAPVDGGWDLLAEFDCDAEHTYGYADEMWRRFRIEVTTPGIYVFEVAAPAVATITLVRTEDWPLGPERPSEPQWPVGDDWLREPEPWHPGWPFDVQLEAGIYDIEARVSGLEPTVAAVRLHPKIGSLPGVP